MYFRASFIESILLKMLLRKVFAMGNKLFGTDGVRGVANVYPMTAEFAFKLACACAKSVAIHRQKVAIAKDTRISGDMLEAALTAGFTSQGVDVILLGVIPTPAVTRLVDGLNVDMAVMITASHNPYYDNGIKLISATGDKFSDEVTEKLEALVAEGDFAYDKDKIGKVTQDSHCLERYKKTAFSIFSTKHPLQGLKVVLDCANGCFSNIMPEVFRALGADVEVLSDKPNGYNINQDCGSQHIEQMVQKVVACQADLGVACDGDGDRIIICDEKGKRLDGDQIIAFLGYYLKSIGNLKANTVVATILSNPALDRYLESIQVQCVRTGVGERNVILEMKRLGANVGGEESGHMVVADYCKTGDSMITALIVAKGLLQSGKKMSEIFPLFVPMLKKRVDSKFATKEAMLKAFEDEDFQKAIADGMQKVEGKGKVLVRKSGTEPKIQVWVWGEDSSFVEKVNCEIASVLTQLDGFESQKDVL